MRFQFIGCGDAFGSGGRFNTCFHLRGAQTNMLIDCGATSLVAMKRLGIARNDIRAILVTHFHADHFGGLPFFILDAQFFSKRTAPLVIAGPPGLKESYVRALETAFPGSSAVKQRFDLALVELPVREMAEIAGAAVTPFPVNHGNPGGPFFAYRIEAEGRTVAYTGDTEWTDVLIEAGRDADLFIAEAYFRDKRVPLHLDLATLEAAPAGDPAQAARAHAYERRHALAAAGRAIRNRRGRADYRTVAGRSGAGSRPRTPSAAATTCPAYRRLAETVGWG